SRRIGLPWEGQGHGTFSRVKQQKIDKQVSGTRELLEMARGGTGEVSLLFTRCQQRGRAYVGPTQRLGAYVPRCSPARGTPSMASAAEIIAVGNPELVAEELVLVDTAITRPRVLGARVHAGALEGTVHRPGRVPEPRWPARLQHGVVGGRRASAGLRVPEPRGRLPRDVRVALNEVGIVEQVVAKRIASRLVVEVPAQLDRAAAVVAA